MIGAVRMLGIGALAMTASPPGQAPSTPNDSELVKIARQMRTVRFRYDVAGTTLQRCDIERSSGDARVDRILCAMLRQCVAEGHSDAAASRACLIRRLDELDPAGARASGDIVVTARSREDRAVVIVGPPPMVSAGLWQFDRSPTISFQAPEDGGQVRTAPRVQQGYRRSQCIPAGTIEHSVRRLLGDEPTARRRIGCSPMQIRLADGRIRGRQSCGGVTGFSDRVVDGTLTPTTLDASIRTRATSSYIDSSGESQSRLTGKRIGSCTP